MTGGDEARGRRRSLEAMRKALQGAIEYGYDRPTAEYLLGVVDGMLSTLPDWPPQVRPEPPAPDQSPRSRRSVFRQRDSQPPDQPAD